MSRDTRMDELERATAALKNAAFEVCNASTRLCAAIERSNGTLKRVLSHPELKEVNGHSAKRI